MTELPGRLSRHEPMITALETRRWDQTRVAVAGMGVGAWMAHLFTLVGVGGLRIADHDRVEITNLNRHPIATVGDLGRLKTDVVREHLEAVSPELEIESFGQIDYFAADRFVFDTSVVIEEVDDWQAKWALRLAAKRHGVCLITATDLWDRVVIDIEDYARQPDWEPFHGLISPDMWWPEAQEVLFAKHCSEKFLRAVTDRRAGFPQFAPTAAVAAGEVVRCVEELLIKGSGRFDSGRYLHDPRSSLERV